MTFRSFVLVLTCPLLATDLLACGGKLAAEEIDPGEYEPVPVRETDCSFAPPASPFQKISEDAVDIKISACGHVAWTDTAGRLFVTSRALEEPTMVSDGITQTSPYDTFFLFSKTGRYLLANTPAGPLSRDLVTGKTTRLEALSKLGPCGENDGREVAMWCSSLGSGIVDLATGRATTATTAECDESELFVTRGYGFLSVGTLEESPTFLSMNFSTGKTERLKSPALPPPLSILSGGSSMGLFGESVIGLSFRGRQRADEEERILFTKFFRLEDGRDLGVDEKLQLLGFGRNFALLSLRPDANADEGARVLWGYGFTGSFTGRPMAILRNDEHEPILSLNASSELFSIDARTLATVKLADDVSRIVTSDDERTFAIQRGVGGLVEFYEEMKATPVTKLKTGEYIRSAAGNATVVLTDGTTFRVVSRFGAQVGESHREPSLYSVGKSGAVFTLDTPIDDGVKRKNDDTLYGIDSKGTTTKLAEGDSFYVVVGGDVIAAVESPLPEDGSPRLGMKLYAGAIP